MRFADLPTLDILSAGPGDMLVDLLGEGDRLLVCPPDQVADFIRRNPVDIVVLQPGASAGDLAALLPTSSVILDHLDAERLFAVRVSKLRSVFQREIRRRDGELEDLSRENSRLRCQLKETERLLIASLEDVKEKNQALQRRNHELDVLAQQEVQLRQRAETLLKVAMVVRTETSLPAILQDIVDVSWQVVGANLARILLLNPEGSGLWLAATSCADPSAEGGSIPVTSPNGLMTRILNERSPVMISDLAGETMTSEEAQLLSQDGYSAALAIPLLYQGSASGVFLLQWSDFSQAPGTELVHDLACGIAELAALALENIQLIQQEADARAKAQLAEEVAREREALIRQIVHDLRNSTQAISLINEEIEVVAAGSPEVLLAVSAIDRQISFISNFLKEKLAWAKQQGQQRADTANLNAVLGRIAERYSPNFDAQGQRLALSASVPAILQLSEIQLEQILSNLLDNAAKFCPKGATVRVWAAISDGWATLYVADNGPGIPVEQQSQIGQLGYRGRTDIDGSGFGLANVKKLANAAGGLFGFTSHPGSGSTFFVTLPTIAWGMVSPTA